MIEISENLHRAELSALEKDRLMREWVEIVTEENHLAQVGPNESKRADKRGHRKQGGIRDAARQLGVDRKVVQRAIKVASLSDDAQAKAKEERVLNQPESIEKGLSSGIGIT